MVWWLCWATTPPSRYKEGCAMPRFYKPFKPSANKAAAPAVETKKKVEKPQKKQKDETGEQ